MTQNFVINRDLLVARAALTGSQLPVVSITHLAALTIKVAFATGSPLAQGSLGDGATVRCVLKETPTGDVLLMDATMTASGTGSSTVYEAVWDDADVDSTALRAFLADATASENWSRKAWLEVEWTISGSTERVFLPVDVRVSFHLPEDDAPDPAADASWAWLKARLAAGTGLTRTVNDSTKVITFASDAGSVPANACTASVSEDGLYLEFRTFAGVLIGKCLLNA